MSDKPAKSQREIVLRHGVYDKQREFMLSNARYRCFISGVGGGKTRSGILEVLRMLIARFNQQTGEMTLKSGTEILWRSADNFEALRGPNLGWVYIDEAALVKESAYDVLLGRLREPPAKLWMTTTPRGYDWIYRLWVKERRSRASSASGGRLRSTSFGESGTLRRDCSRSTSVTSR